MDTRESGPGLSGALIDGLRREGVNCLFAGILPTPGVAHLTRRRDFSLGVMISASHNPYRDNGIKFFSSEGHKLPDEIEAKIEVLLEDLRGHADGPSSVGPPSAGDDEPREAYLEWLVEQADGADFRGVTVALDAAHGAAFDLAPRLFESLGARVFRRGCEPDGVNINRGCGSTCLDPLKAFVAEVGADIGMAYDGDADRCLAVTPSGALLDGDYILYHEACRRFEKGSLAADLVVGTVMSNLWLEKALQAREIRFLRAPVGDRYVLERLIEEGGELGGEPSGHVIFLDRATTGDGLLTSLVTARLAAGNGERLVEGINPYPQLLTNLRVGRRTDLEADERASAVLHEEQNRLGKAGRLLVRYSGTEPLLRIMVEAESLDLAQDSTRRLAAFFEAHLGLNPAQEDKKGEIP